MGTLTRGTTCHQQRGKELGSRPPTCMERLLGISLSNSMLSDYETSSSSWFLKHITQILNPTESPPKSARLPNELYRVILSYLPLDAKIFPLLLVNSAFHAEAKRLLYTNISLAGNLWGSKQDHMFRRMRLFKLLAQTPRIAVTVESLSIRPFIYKGDLANYGTRIKYWRDLNLALREMINLKEFAMGRLAGENQYPVEGLAEQSIKAVFSGCTFRLRKLVIFQGDFQNVEVLENGVVGMDLEELCVPYQIGMMFEDNRSLPQLAVLEILWQFDRIPALLAPPRSVKALSWRVRRAELWTPETYPELVSLKIEMLSQNAVDFARLAVVFPSLRFLHIDFPDGLVRCPIYSLSL